MYQSPDKKSIIWNQDLNHVKCCFFLLARWLASLDNQQKISKYSSWQKTKDKFGQWYFFHRYEFDYDTRDGKPTMCMVDSAVSMCKITLM